MVVVDTSVWSLAFRRGGPARDPTVDRLVHLLAQGPEPCLTGVVLQELLQGLTEPAAARVAATALDPFKVLETRRETHIAAAGIRRAARARGVTVGTIDCLIAAVTIEWGATLLTADRDFDHLAAAAGLRLEMAIVR